MRYVAFRPDRLDGERIPDEARAEIEAWLVRAADAARQAVRDFERDGKPADEIEDIWRSHKYWLLRYTFGNKCAYCEKSMSDIPKDAEHWRPKRRITGSTVADHPGYFWLAYSWRNLLPVCSMCNSYDGKKNQFPVTKAHVFRVTRPAQLLRPDEAIPSSTEPDAWYLGAEDLDALEEPLLLHPYVDQDLTVHLEFRPDGAVKGHTKKGEWSIKVFDLAREDLRKARAKAERAIDNGLRIRQQQAVELGGLDDAEGLEEAKATMDGILAGGRAEYSATKCAALTRTYQELLAKLSRPGGPRPRGGGR